MRKDLTLWGATALLIGTQIGAGMLGLPRVIAPLGFFWGTIALFLAGLFSALTAVMLVEAIYLTNPRYHYFDLASEHLGRWGKILVLFVLYSGYLALTAYLSGLGEVLSSAFGGDPRFWAVGLWAVLSTFVFLGVRVSGTADESLVLFIFLSIAAIATWAVTQIHPYDAEISFIPFAVASSVALFAFSGHMVIPEIVQGTRNMFRSVGAILIAFALVFVAYAVFSLSIVGALGGDVPDIGILGLIDLVDPGLRWVAYALPLLTITTSFIGVGLAQKDILREMVRGNVLAFILAVLPPLLIYLLFPSGFVHMIWLASFGTIVAVGIIPTLVLLRARKEKGRALLPIPDGLVYLSLGFYMLVFFLSALGLV